MRALTEDEFRAEAEPFLRRVFISDNPFGPAFAPDVPVRRIAFGFEYDLKYVVKPPLIDAVVTAASRIGDTGCYFTVLWRWSANEEVTEEPNHWYIPFSEFSAYREGSDEFGFAFLRENVLYSPQGKWGIMTSHEYYGLLGGTQEFMEEVRQLIPDLDEQVDGFLENWQHHKAHSRSAKTDWLPGLLTQIYGHATAEKMLQEAGLP